MSKITKEYFVVLQWYHRYYKRIIIYRLLTSCFAMCVRGFLHRSCFRVKTPTLVHDRVFLILESSYDSFWGFAIMILNSMSWIC